MLPWGWISMNSIWCTPCICIELVYIWISTQVYSWILWSAKWSNLHAHTQSRQLVGILHFVHIDRDKCKATWGLINITGEQKDPSLRSCMGEFWHTRTFRINLCIYVRRMCMSWCMYGSSSQTGTGCGRHGYSLVSFFFLYRSIPCSLFLNSICLCLCFVASVYCVNSRNLYNLNGRKHHMTSMHFENLLFF